MKFTIIIGAALCSVRCNTSFNSCFHIRLADFESVKITRFDISTLFIATNLRSVYNLEFAFIAFQSTCIFKGEWLVQLNSQRTLCNFVAQAFKRKHFM